MSNIKYLPSELRLIIKTRQLQTGTGNITLSGKTFALLSYLIKHPNQILSTAEILDAVWPDRDVNDTEVRYYIRELRKLLYDDHRAPRFIETIHGKGYRFIGTLPQEDGEPTASPIPDGSIIDREHELNQLHACLEQSFSGECQFVLVSGEPGIGKTTLIQSFTTPLQNSAEVCLIRGQCVESYGRGEPFMPVLAALTALGQTESDLPLREYLERYAPLWLMQMPDLLESSDNFEALRIKTQGVTPTRMLRECAQMLSALSSNRGIILWLEDLHWADTSTLTLIDYFVRHSSAARLMIIASSRAPESLDDQHPLLRLRAELSLHRYCRELPLKPFDQVSVRRYLQNNFTGLPLTLADSLHRHTAGNPLFIKHVVEDLRSRQILGGTSQNWQLSIEMSRFVPETPDNLRILIMDQYRRLQDSERRVLEIACVAGTVFSAAIIAAVLNWEPDMVEDLCDRLIRRKTFLHFNSDDITADEIIQNRYTFSHPLYQCALYQETPKHQRRRLHRLIGLTLEQHCLGYSKNIATQLAIHFEKCDDKPRAIRYYRQAADVALSRQAGQEACQHLEKALSLLRCLPANLERDKTEQDILASAGHTLNAS